MNISFQVRGTPQPAGSKRGFNMGGHVRIVDANPKSSKWKMFVASCAANEIARSGHRAPVFTGPVSLHLTFILERPKSHMGSGKNAGKVKGSAPAHHISAPDVLKLARGVEDALTGILYVDDAQIVEEGLVKLYALEADEPGVFVTVYPLVVAKEAVQA